MPDKKAVLEVLAAAQDDSSGSPLATRICVACARSLPFDSASLAVTSRGLGPETLGASDDLSRGIAELQTTLGEGPSIDALVSGHPFLLHDLDDLNQASRWPVFSRTVASLRPPRALFAFPIQIGTEKLGVLALHREHAERLAPDDLADCLRTADLIALLMLGRDGTLAADFDERWLEGSLWRQEIHQAVGMVVIQLGVDAGEALLQLRAHAFAQGASLTDVARDVVARRLRFTEDQA